MEADWRLSSRVACRRVNAGVRLSPRVVCRRWMVPYDRCSKSCTAGADSAYRRIWERGKSFMAETWSPGRRLSPRVACLRLNAGKRLGLRVTCWRGAGRGREFEGHMSALAWTRKVLLSWPRSCKVSNECAGGARCRAHCGGASLSDDGGDSPDGQVGPTRTSATVGCGEVWTQKKTCNGKLTSIVEMPVFENTRKRRMKWQV